MTYAKTLTLNMEFLWSFVVRGRAGFKCELWGRDALACGGSLQAMHIVTRGVKGIKFDLRNGRCGCQRHHVYYTYHPEFWAVIAAKLWPDDWEYLNGKKWKGVETSIDREGVFVELRLEAQKYQWKFIEYLPKIQRIDAWIAGIVERSGAKETKIE
jgi:hypothetical protein